MKKPNLIYYIAFGDYYYREMVKFSIISILDYTNYSGDFIVLSDSVGIPMPETFKNRVRVIDVGTERAELLNKFNIFCVKSWIHKYINLLDYNFCLYLDSDVLVNYDKFNELLDFFAASNKIQVSDNDGWTIQKNHHTVGSQVLTPKEKLDFRDFGVCAGVLGIPCNQLGLSLLEDWYEMNKLGEWKLDDQGNLTALLIRKYSKDYSWMPLLNKNRWKMENITHYCSGNSKHLFWNHVRFILRNYQLKLNPLIGKWTMDKPGENLRNTWDIVPGMVYVDNPMITGFSQDTKFGKYIWWSSLDGFELIRLDFRLPCLSFRGGEFTLHPQIQEAHQS